MAGALLLPAGLLLLGVGTLRAGVLPPWTGWALLAGMLGFLFVERGGAFVLGGACVALGARLLATRWAGTSPGRPPADTLARVAGPAAILGGLLWAPYGVFEMLEPWGAAKVYREDVGYSLVTDTTLFVAYSLPGSLALLLTAAGLLGILARLGLPAARTGRIGRLLAYVALALGALSLAGVVALFDPLFTAARIFGTLALGAATCLAGLAARGAGAPPGWAAGLLLLGLLGLSLLPLSTPCSCCPRGRGRPASPYSASAGQSQAIASGRPPVSRRPAKAGQGKRPSSITT